METYIQAQVACLRDRPPTLQQLILYRYVLTNDYLDRRTKNNNRIPTQHTMIWKKTLQSINRDTCTNQSLKMEKKDPLSERSYWGLWPPMATLSVHQRNCYSKTPFQRVKPWETSNLPHTHSERNHQYDKPTALYQML